MFTGLCEYRQEKRKEWGTRELETEEHRTGKGVIKMVINHVKHEFDVETQTEMFDLIRHIANCELFEVDGLKILAKRLLARAGENSTVT